MPPKSKLAKVNHAAFKPPRSLISFGTLASSGDNVNIAANLPSRSATRKRTRPALSDDSDDRSEEKGSVESDEDIVPFDDDDLGSLEDFIDDDDDLNELVRGPTDGLVTRRTTGRSGKSNVQISKEGTSSDMTLDAVGSPLSSSFPKLEISPDQLANPQNRRVQEYNTANKDNEDHDPLPEFPKPLLTRILHEHFRKKDTRIDVDAMVVFTKYIETFTREAIARAIFEKEEAHGVIHGLGKHSDNFLEVEDLEKLAVQLLLDF